MKPMGRTTKRKFDVPSLTRSEVMARIPSINTKPELLVRRLLTHLGYRYRLHRSDLPGKPDVAFISRRKAIFVHGCFWHGHDCKRGARVPKTNREYWTAKIARNKVRDAAALTGLAGQGWNCLTLYECELGDAAGLAQRLNSFLQP